MKKIHQYIQSLNYTKLNEYLAKKPHKINVYNNDPPLNVACGLAFEDDDHQDESLQMLIFLIEKGANVNLFDDRKTSPLHLACEYGSFQMIEILIKKKAEINIKNDKLRSPLFLACRSGRDYDVINLLIKNGADVNTRDKNKNTPLHQAAASCDSSVIRLLIEKGANVNSRNLYDETPLLKITQLPFRAVQKTKVIMELIKNGADVNARDYMGLTPLHEACRKCNVGYVTILIKNGADVNAVDLKKQTPIFTVKSCQILSILIENGADINVLNDNGHTPMRRNLKYNYMRLMTNCFLKEGASLLIGKTIFEKKTKENKIVFLYYLKLQKFISLSFVFKNKFNLRAFRKFINTMDQSLL